ncbi:MAG: corrinoid activation/regeneration protein AcsV [Oscillospiraceae bacterium]
MPKVTFKINGCDDICISSAGTESLLSLARKANVAIDAPCSGNGSCGKCRIKLIGGELKSPKSRHISEEEYAAGYRLACISEVVSDVTIEVPDIASAYKNRMKVADLSSKAELEIFYNIQKEISEADIKFENDFVEFEVVVPVPSLDDTMPDNERLGRAIAALFPEVRIKYTYSVLRKLPDILRESGFKVKCIASFNERRMKILDIVVSDDLKPCCGLAIDIGTTTVSGLLVELKNGHILAKASAGNGQIRYGADVINRIVESQKEGGRDRLQKAVVEETINPMIREMCAHAGIDSSRVYSIVIASNTTMNHLLAGVDADPLRKEPYVPAFYGTEAIEARDIEICACPDAKIIIAPNIGSYVGGDITAGTLASMAWNRPEMSVFIDLGTNGEIVFGNSDFLMSCACSAGPAFEGGDISCGMRATDGAIEKCTIDPNTMEPVFEIIGAEGQKPIGVCGSGIIDIISELYKHGIINAKGVLVREGKRIRRDEFGVGSYVLAFREESCSVRDIEITEADIDNFVRAKGAIFSAINTMLQSLDFDVSMVEKVYVAGGIGSGINMQNAIGIGMFPDIPVEKYEYIGNSALCGAYAMLCSNQAREKVNELARSMTYLELSTTPGYMDAFVAACFIPHTDASLFPSVSQDFRG